MHKKLLDEMVEAALISDGCIKFDLKAWDENLHMALTGVTNRRTMANFKRAAEQFNRRPTPCLLLTNTLLVPGYIDEDEIRGIAKFIASFNPDIPYSLLAFHPQFYMSDMPPTSKDLALRCKSAAKEAELKNVRVGNFHLLV